MTEPELFYVHSYAPPTPGWGSTEIAYRLLSRLFPPMVRTFTDRRLRDRVREGDRTLPGPYQYFLKPSGVGSRFLGVGQAVVGMASLLLACLAGIRAGLMARRHGAGWILSVVDEGYSQVAGHVCARVSGVPHLVWVFDLWSENAYNRFERWSARRLEGRIWRRATAILVHADELADHYERKHGIRCRVLPMPSDLPDAEPMDAAAEPGSPTRELLVTGAVYWMQAEAIRRLLRVSAQIPELRVTMLGDAESLRSQGIVPDRVEPILSAERYQERLREADILFLGLSFDSDYPDVVRTATTSRRMEYMASGTPLVIHAPAGSHVAEYARSADLATVVDRPDDEELRRALVELVSDPERGRARAERARRVLAEQHGTEGVAAQLRQVLADTGRGARGEGPAAGESRGS